jgi:hypothetical protein
MTQFLSQHPENLVIRNDAVLHDEPVAKDEAIHADAFERPGGPGTLAAPSDESGIGSVRILLNFQAEVRHQIDKVEHPLQVVRYASHCAATAGPMADDIPPDHGLDSLLRDLEIGFRPEPPPALDRPSIGVRRLLRAAEHDDLGFDAVPALQPGLLIRGGFIERMRPLRAVEFNDSDAIGRLPPLKYRSRRASREILSAGRFHRRGRQSKSSIGGIAKKDRQSRRLADARGNKSTGADKPALPH